MRVVTNYQTTLSASITSSQSNIPVSSIQTTDASPHTLTIDDFDGQVFLTIEPGTSKEELVRCTGITPGTLPAGTFTSAVRGLAFYGGSLSSIPANAYAHQAGSRVIVSDVHYVFDELVDNNSDETIGGVKTFTESPLVPTPISSELTAAASVEYVNSVAIAGAPDASPTVKGIVEQTTTAQLNAGTNTGETGAVLFPSPADLAASIYGLQLPSADQKAALSGTSGTPTAINAYATENDTSNFAIKTATTISFVAATKTIADSGSGLVTAGFRPGASIVVSGTSSNNGTYTIASVAAGAIVVLETLIDEAAGGSVTLTTVSVNKVVRADGSGTIPRSFNTPLDTQNFTSNGTWTKPTGALWVRVIAIGGGGGGGGKAATNLNGGTGGGGGAYVERFFKASDLPSTVSVVVGASAAGGVGGNDGDNGNPSTFGSTLVVAGGGRGGKQASVSSIPGGNGGSARDIGASTTAGGGRGGAGVSASNGTDAEFGGGAGGGNGTGAKAGGFSVYGGGGGGGSFAGEAGGTGGDGGTGTGGTAGNAGSAGNIFGGGGGGGGGTANGATGGAGGIPGGGGGAAGAGASALAGTGGAGARGEVWVISW